MAIPTTSSQTRERILKLLENLLDDEGKYTYVVQTSQSVIQAKRTDANLPPYPWERVGTPKQLKRHNQKE